MSSTFLEFCYFDVPVISVINEGGKVKRVTVRSIRSMRFKARADGRVVVEQGLYSVNSFWFLKLVSVCFEVRGPCWHVLLGHFRSSSSSCPLFYHCPLWAGQRGTPQLVRTVNSLLCPLKAPCGGVWEFCSTPQLIKTFLKVKERIWQSEEILNFWRRGVLCNHQVVCL